MIPAPGVARQPFTAKDKPSCFNEVGLIYTYGVLPLFIMIINQPKGAMTAQLRVMRSAGLPLGWRAGQSLSHRCRGGRGRGVAAGGLGGLGIRSTRLAGRDQIGWAGYDML